MRSRMGLFLALVLLLVVTGTAAAGDGDDFEHTSYEDTGEVTFDELDVLSMLLALFESLSEEGVEDVEEAPAPLVTNGDFSQWNGGSPTGWSFWTDGPKAGWEQPHLANVGLARGEGSNAGLGFFVRNVGGDGGFFAGAYQQLANVETAGHYWVTVHSSMFGQFNSVEFENGYYAQHPFNAMAWYGLGDSAAPSSVTQWRELYPQGDLPGFTPCLNEWEVCIYGARYETLYIEPGQYLHVKAGHKFPVFNDWTTFVFDDISIVPADGKVIADGFIADGILFWDDEAER